MIFTKEDASTSDKQVEALSRDYNIQYRACVGSLIFILSTKVDLCFAVHKMGKCSSNNGKVQFVSLVHLLRYIRNNKNLEIKYYANIEDAPLFYLLRQVTITSDKLVHLDKHNICSCTSFSIWTVLTAVIREHHQLIITINCNLPQ